MVPFDPAVLDPKQRELLAEAVRRVVDVARPTRIVLFGSAVRGVMGPDSDFDLLVVVPGPVHRGRLAGRIYASMIGVRAPVDVVVVCEDDLAGREDDHVSVIGTALREGRVVHAA